MIDPWFVTGFCEGEAAFTFSRQGNNLALYFAIKLNEADKSLIQDIADFFNVGRIYRVKPRLPGNRSGDTKPAIYYRVSKLTELELVIKHFDQYPLQGKKAESYKVWKNMWAAKRRFRRPNIEELNVLATQLSKLSSKNTAKRNRWPRL